MSNSGHLALVNDRLDEICILISNIWMLFNDLTDAFSDLEDFRAENHRYPLPHLAFIAVCMVLCGADD